jgi:hypothetical protein
MSLTLLRFMFSGGIMGLAIAGLLGVDTSTTGNMITCATVGAVATFALLRKSALV